MVRVYRLWREWKWHHSECLHPHLWIVDTSPLTQSSQLLQSIQAVVRSSCKAVDRLSWVWLCPWILSCADCTLLHSPIWYELITDFTLQVLSKATEYINHLEKRNKRLQDENAAQKARLAAFETLFRSGSMGFNPTPMNNPFQYSPDYHTPGPSPTNDPQGMIQVPDDIRRLHSKLFLPHHVNTSSRVLCLLLCSKLEP